MFPRSLVEGRKIPPSLVKNKRVQKNMDRIFCSLLAVAAAGHVFGTFKFFEFGTNGFVWALSGGFACALLATINFLRTSRPTDGALRWLTVFGNIGWMGIALLFGESIGNLLDRRVLLHEIAAAGVTCFSVTGFFR